MKPTIISIFFIIYFIGGWDTVRGYSTGAPLNDEICTSMRPEHPGEPQTEKLPYRITLDKKNIKVGEYVTLQIRSINGKGNASLTGEKFKGFLVQGRKLSGLSIINGTADADEEKPIGEFIVDEKSNDSQTLNCAGLENSAVTHLKGEDKTKVIVKWRAPKESGAYILLTTVVQSGKVYWTRQPSAIITVV